MKVKKLLLIVIVFTAIIFVAACEKEEDTNRNGYDYLVLVNKYSQLPDDWEDKVELVDAKNAWDEDIQLEKEAYDNYLKLEAALKKEGVSIVLDSVYRSVQEQQDLWDEWAADPEKGLDYVKKIVAVPGFSEHHTGLAIDICLMVDGELVFDNDEMIEERDIFEKIHKKLADYGFILRYLENREDSTGYTYEPWHLRYIGSKKIAKYIMDNDLTFEEYLESVTDYNKYPEAAKYRIETTLKKEFEEKTYKDKISNVRFDVKKIYTSKDAKDDSTIKGLELGDKDLAFEVEYQLLPQEGIDYNTLIVTDGKYNEELGWVTNINRLGVIRYENGSYTVTQLDTGW